MQHRPYYFANEWSKIGHKVTIITASFSHLRRIQPKVDKSMMEEEIDGIRYVWIKTTKYRGNGVKRIWHMLEFAWRLIWFKNRIASALKPDVVIASSPHPFSIFGSKAIARLSGSKLVYEVRDLWPLTLIELGKKSSLHPFIAFMQYAENYAYRVSDYVVSLLPEAQAYMIQHGMKAEKFYYLPNGIHVDEWIEKKEKVSLDCEEVLQRLKAEGKFLLGYAGAHGFANSLECLIDAAILLREKPVAVILIGDGPEKEELQKKAMEAGLCNVLFLPSIPKSSIPRFLDEMDALFVGLKNEPLYRFGISLNKLFDYMMAAKPIIFSGEVSNNLVKEYRCGLSIIPENPKAIAEGVMEVLSLPFEERLEMGKRGREGVLANHNLQYLARRFTAELEKKEIRYNRKTSEN